MGGKGSRCKEAKRMENQKVKKKISNEGRGITVGRVLRGTAETEVKMKLYA